MLSLSLVGYLVIMIASMVIMTRNTIYRTVALTSAFHIEATYPLRRPINDNTMNIHNTRQHNFLQVQRHNDGLPILTTRRQSSTSSTSSSQSLTVDTMSELSADDAISLSSSSKPSTVTNVEQYHNVILFDGICNFCNTWVDILLRFDVRGKFRYTPLQSSIGQALLVEIGKEANDISSVILIQNKNRQGDSNNNNNNQSSSSLSSSRLQHYEKSSCVLQVVKELGPIGHIFASSLQFLLPSSLCDNIYDIVAENRYNIMGKRDACRYGDPNYYDRFIS